MSRQSPGGRPSHRCHCCGRHLCSRSWRGRGRVAGRQRAAALNTALYALGRWRIVEGEGKEGGGLRRVVRGSRTVLWCCGRAWGLGSVRVGDGRWGRCRAGVSARWQLRGEGQGREGRRWAIRLGCAGGLGRVSVGDMARVRVYTCSRTQSRLHSSAMTPQVHG
jgi:hypothetical protein